MGPQMCSMGCDHQERSVFSRIQSFIIKYSHLFGDDIISFVVTNDMFMGHIDNRLYLVFLYAETLSK